MTGAEKDTVSRLIRRIRDDGVTVLLVEHDMRLVMGVSDTVVVLNHGAVIAEGPPAAIQSHPAVIRAYLGSGGAPA
jgi:ABC-type branched-subunit amino acid transport system ATPase component